MRAACMRPTPSAPPPAPCSPASSLIPALGLRGTTFVGVAFNLIAAGGAWLHRAWRGRCRRRASAGSRCAGSRQPQEGQEATEPAAPGSRPSRALARRRRARRQRLRVAHTAGRLDAAARPDPRADDLRVQHRGRDLHHRHRRRRGDRIAPGRAREEPWRRSRVLAADQRRHSRWRRRRRVDWALLTIGEIVSRPDYQFADVLRREVLLVSALLLPMTIAFGAAFPFAVALAGGRDDSVTAAHRPGLRGQHARRDPRLAARRLRAGAR